MTRITCRLTAKNPDQLRNPTLGNRVWATFTFTFLSMVVARSSSGSVAIRCVLSVLSMTSYLGHVEACRYCCSEWRHCVVVGRLTPSLHQNYRSPSCKKCGGGVCWYVTYILWPWPFYLEQVSYMAGHVTNLATKFEDPMPVRSWVMSYNVSRWLPLKMRTHCNGACDALLACDFTSGNVAKYCDDRVCLCVCLCICVCLSASISLERHIWS